MAVASPTRRHALLAPPWTPKRLPGLRFWMEADHSPLTLEAGMAAQFTRANSEKLSITDNASLSTGDIDYWLCGWFYADSTPVGDQMGIISKYGAGGSREYDLYLNATPRLVLNVFDGTNNIGTVNHGTTLSLATWYFVVAYHSATDNETGVSLNGGAFTTAVTTGAPIDTGSPVELGAAWNTSGYFDGGLQCVAFGKGPKPSAAQVTALYNGGVPLSAAAARPIAGPGSDMGGISYWELNEPSGTRVDSWGTNDLTDNNTVTTNPGTCLNAVGQINDLSGFGNNATQSTQANKPVLRGGPNGIGGRPALRFDGVNDQLATAAFAAAISQPFTIAHVVKLSATAAAQTFSDGVANKVIVGTDATPNYVLNASAGADTVAGTPNTSAHILIATFDATDRLYVDGAQVISADAGANTLDGLRIGATLGSANFLGGLWTGSVLCQGALTEQDRRWLERYWSRCRSIAVS